MLKKLEEIADDLATLKRATEKTGSPEDFMRSQLVEHLEWTLRDLADRPGMISSPAPWWLDRQNKYP